MTTFTRELETVGRTRATVTPRLLSICSCLVVGLGPLDHGTDQGGACGAASGAPRAGLRPWGPRPARPSAVPTDNATNLTGPSSGHTVRHVPVFLAARLCRSQGLGSYQEDWDEPGTV
jgi:hypothetical protein